MDCWVQRIFAVGLVAIVIALLWYASTGQDGRVLDLISGVIVGMMVGLGISNTQVVESVKKMLPTGSKESK